MVVISFVFSAWNINEFENVPDNIGNKWLEIYGNHICELWFKNGFERDLCGNEHHLRSSENIVWKNSGLNGIWTHDLCNTGAVLWQLCFHFCLSGVHYCEDCFQILCWGWWHIVRFSIRFDLSLCPNWGGVKFLPLHSLRAIFSCCNI